ELHTSWICGLTALGGIFSGILLGKLCDRYTPQKVAVPALIVSSATMFLMGVAGNLGLYGAMRFVNSLAGSGLETGLLALLSKFTRVERRGAIFGLASSIRMSGILVSTFLSGAVVYAYGLRAVCYAAGGLFILCVPLFWATAKFVSSPNDNDFSEKNI
ncbi:MAG: MFS transporter, partial [Planctomycetaceae bacterium]|nr:MFS transporter [Planctomycetaceae bacterium]